MRNGASQGIYDTPDCVFVGPHAPYRPCGIPVRRLHIDPRERRQRRPYIATALLEGTSVQARRRTRVREDHSDGTRQAARQACRCGDGLRTPCRPAQRSEAGRVAVWERHERGRSVTWPARQYSVTGVRRNFLLLRSSNRALEAGEPLRQYILDGYSRLEERA